MTGQDEMICVAANGYGGIGKRVADAVACQADVGLVGVADIETDWRMRTALRKGFRLFASMTCSSMWTRSSTARPSRSGRRTPSATRRMA